MDQSFTITFWGVRGTIPATGARFSRYGGNTSCVEVRCGESVLILDAGTGLYQLGEKINVSDCDILLSHTHLDHVIGLPYFMPFYQENNDVHLWAGHLPEDISIKSVVEQLMHPTLFPLRPDNFKANICYHDFSAGERLTAPHLDKRGIVIETHSLNHPGGATGYRIRYNSRSVCYITDIEHTSDELDEGLTEFVMGTDLLLYDSTYSEEEYAAHVGWGHSTWEHAVQLANTAMVKQLGLFHHHQCMDDTMMSRREEKLREMRPQAFAAKEGMILTL